MQIILPWFKENCSPEVRSLGCNRYNLWTDATETIWGPFSDPPLNDRDLKVARIWISVQKEWNLHLTVLRDIRKIPRVLAIAGAEGNYPEWIVYPHNGGYQCDESFESSWFPSLDAALCEIGAMPKGACLISLAAKQAGDDTYGIQ